MTEIPPGPAQVGMVKDEWGCPLRTPEFMFGQRTEGCTAFYEQPSVFDKAAQRRRDSHLGGRQPRFHASGTCDEADVLAPPGPGAYAPHKTYKWMWETRPSSTKGTIGACHPGPAVGACVCRACTCERTRVGAALACP